MEQEIIVNNKALYNEDLTVQALSSNPLIKSRQPFDDITVKVLFERWLVGDQNGGHTYNLNSLNICYVWRHVRHRHFNDDMMRFTIKKNIKWDWIIRKIISFN